MGYYAAAIAAAGSILGSSMTNKANANLNRANRDFNAQQAALDRQFQKEMSDTAMTRRVQDLKNAGLNPILGVSGAGAASTPGGSTASAGSTVPMGNVVGSGVSGAVEGFRAANEGTAQLSSAAQAKAQADLIKATIPKVEAEVTNLYYGGMKLQEEIYGTRVQNAISVLTEKERTAVLPSIIELMTNEAERSRLGLPALKNASEAEKSWWKKNITPYLEDLGKVSGAASSAAGAAGNLKFLAK